MFVCGRFGLMWPQMPDMTVNSGDGAETDASEETGLVLDAESHPQRVSDRLHDAIAKAGGNAAVMARSGVKNSTLRRVLKGQDAKTGVLVALADACGVSVNWLATGRDGGSRGFADAPVAHLVPGSHSASELGMLAWLRHAVDAAGGADRVAQLARVPADAVRTLLAGGRSPHLQAVLDGLGSATAQMPALFDEAHVSVAQATDALPEVPPILGQLDFEALVMCLELQEALDKLGGGQLKSVRSRLQRALHAYNLAKSEKE